MNSASLMYDAVPKAGTPLTVLRIRGYVFCRMSLSWDLSDVFIMVILGYCVFERKTTKVKYYYHHIISTYYQHDLSLLMLTMITWQRQCLWGFSRVNLFFPYFHYVLFRRNYFGWSTLPWGWNVYINYLEFLCTGDVLFSPIYLLIYLFSHLFVPVLAHEYLF